MSQQLSKMRKMDEEKSEFMSSMYRKLEDTETDKIQEIDRIKELHRYIGLHCWIYIYDYFVFVVFCRWLLVWQTIIDNFFGGICPSHFSSLCFDIKV